MIELRQVESPAALLAESFDPAKKTVVEIGCGTGELARALTARGARVVAIDRFEMLVRPSGVARDIYVAATGEALPVADAWADAVLYIASLHHLPSDHLDEALAECIRVLKPGGRAFFIEPIQSCGSWGDLTRLIEDETEVQKFAYEAIVRAAASGLEMLREERFFVPRSFKDFQQTVETFVDDPALRPEVVARARAITEQRSAGNGDRFDDYRYRSICRLNILRRTASQS